MTDTAIEKSALYSIDGGEVNMQFKGRGVIRFAPLQINGVELYVAMIPNDVSADQVTKLADLERIGGKIVARAGHNVPGGPLPATNPAAQSVKPN